MSDYEWDGWLDEKLVVFGVYGQKREKKKAHEEDTHRFRFLFFFINSSSEIDRE